MIIVDAVCPVHGLVRVPLPLPPGAMIQNCGTDCPICRRPAEIVDGVYDFVGRVVRTVRESSATRSQTAELRAVVERVAAGELSTAEATAEAAAINPAFVRLIPPQDSNLWLILLAVLALLSALYGNWSSDKASKQAHLDAEKQLQATQSVERATRKIYEELHRPSLVAKAQAKSAQPKMPSPEKRRAEGLTRQQWRAAHKPWKHRPPPVK